MGLCVSKPSMKTKDTKEFLKELGIEETFPKPPLRSSRRKKVFGTLVI